MANNVSPFMLQAGEWILGSRRKKTFDRTKSLKISWAKSY